MSDNFHIGPLASNGDLDPAPEGGVWYVKEGDFVHAKCTSPDLANLVLGGVRAARQLRTDLKNKEIQEHIFQCEKGVVTTRSELARDLWPKRLHKTVTDLSDIKETTKNSTTTPAEAKTSTNTTSIGAPEKPSPPDPNV